VLRARLAELEAAARHAEEAADRRGESDAGRIVALERQLQCAHQTLAEREAALQRLEELQKPTAETGPAQHQASAEGQSTELKGAQDKIAELLERLAQLEAERHMQQESAAHELQQLRESFETRITRLRMELTTKAPSQAAVQLPADNPSVTSGLAEGVQRQIQELQSQLAEKHTLLENRNEELIKVKAELDALRDHFARLSTDAGQESIKEPPSVELREEDAVEPPPRFFNGSGRRPDPLSARGAEEAANSATNAELSQGGASNRFAQLEGRLRSWSPKAEKDSAFGTGRRWNIGIFKRRWKS
jgi:chromosome segregation ATPase